MKPTITWVLSVSVLYAQQKPPSHVDTQQLFKRTFSITTPIVQAHIPAETCRAIISQADRLITVDELKSVEKDHLQVASENLRACATSDQLTRVDRDLAVGLYGEVVSEQERRGRP
jgi:hypothetical protein